MSSNLWEHRPIQDIAEMVTDYVANGSFASLAANVVYKEEPDYATLIRLTDYKNSFGGPFVYVDEQAYRFLAKSKLLGGEIIIANVGANAGEVFLAPKLKTKMTLGPNAIMLKTKYNDLFYYYWLTSTEGQAKIQSIMTGSAQPKFNKTDFRKIEVPVPPVDVQNQIASILSALDNKIEINRQINKTLEKIAQAIFKEWFVDFNYPGATGELVESELGLIPKGWKVQNIENICELNNNVISRADSFGWIDYIEISDVTKGEIGNSTRYEYGQEPSRARRKIKHGDTVISTIRPSRGSYFLSQHPNNTTIVSTGFAVFSPTIASDCFLYLHLTQPQKITFYGQIADGAAYPAINPSLIMQMKIAVPYTKILAEFQSIVAPIFEKQWINNQQTKTLGILRDWLLPRLMSGEIEL